MSWKEWLAVIIVIGVGVVWQMRGQDDPIPAGGEQHMPSPAQVESTEREGASAPPNAAEAAGPYRTIALEVTGMT